jgi:hypothetical protein
MRELALLAIHLLVTLAKLLRPGGIRAVAAESLLLKHQILIGNRARRRAPNLTTVDRVVLGLTTLFVNPRREAWPAHQACNPVQVPPGLGGSEIPPAFFLFSQPTHAWSERAIPGTHRGDHRDEAPQSALWLRANRPADHDPTVPLPP